MNYVIMIDALVGYVQEHNERYVYLPQPPVPANEALVNRHTCSRKEVQAEPVLAGFVEESFRNFSGIP